MRHAWGVFHMDKAGIEIGFGDFQHLAASLFDLRPARRGAPRAAAAPAFLAMASLLRWSPDATIHSGL